LSSFVEEISEDIEHATQYCEVRDLLAAWRERAPSGAAEPAPLLADVGGMLDRLMLLMPEAGEGDLVYEQVGAAVVALMGHNPRGRHLGELDNPGIRLFRDIYRRVAVGTAPRLCIHHRVGASAMGVNERLLLPVRDGDRRGLLIYLRGRETENDVLRSVFNASTDSITVIEALRDPIGRIVDFRIIAANAETGRRMGVEPAAMIGRTILDIWPSAGEIGLVGRFGEAVQKQAAVTFDTSYVSVGAIVERQIRIVPSGESLTVTNVDIGPQLAASRAIEKQRNELISANALLERRALDLKASNEVLEATARDLREEIARNRVLEAELIHLARHDGLTGLPNRSHFEARFDEALADAAGKGRSIALCMIDVDHFKDINDRFGHSTGDVVLREVSARLRSALGADDLVGRMGGDEFAVLLVEGEDEACAKRTIQRIADRVMAPFTVERQDVPISLSIGIAAFPQHGGTARDLMAAADLAVYRAKHDGRGRPVFFDISLRQEAERLYRLIGRVAAGLEAGEFRPHYQPILDLRTGQLIGFEALARWYHPERGILAPASFLEALEVPDIAQAVTRTMLDGVVRDLVRWSGRDIPAHVSINVTSFDLRRPDFASEVVAKLASNDLSSRQLAIEVTETTVLSRDSGRIAQTLAELRRLGFSVGLDDFGTGFASLSHLLRLPVDSLKIDRSFVDDLEVSPKTAAVVQSLVSLAAALHLDIVAEGVETRSQLDLLRAMGCHLVQGYLVAKPMSAEDVPGFTREFSLTPSRRPTPMRSVG